MSHRNTGIENFLSLGWYEVVLRFLFTFVAKTSEVLLAAGLVVSTANFLTDGSILVTHPDVSIAWAWAQALAIDSSLGVSLSYTFQYLKQEEWIRGTLYGMLTLLLALVAGAITTIDVVSHALHVPTTGAMEQMGISVVILGRLRAIAVIGFILMSRLRDLPLTDLLTKTEPALPPSSAPTRGQSQASPIQTTIQALCSQFSAEEMAQIFNACLAAKKIVFSQEPPKKAPKLHQPQVEQDHWSHQLDKASEPGGASQTEPRTIPQMQSALTPLQSMESEPSENGPVTREPRAQVEHHRRSDEVPFPQMDQVPVAVDPSKEPTVEQGTAGGPQSGSAGQLEPEAMLPQERLERAYQSLLAEGKKPSGRALAERAHVHRSTCVTWLRTRDAQSGEHQANREQSEYRSVPGVATSLDTALMGPEGSVPIDKNGSVPVESAASSAMELLAMEMALPESADSAFPDASPNFRLPEDTLHD